MTECQYLHNTGTSPDMSLPRRNNYKPVNEWSSHWHVTRFIIYFRQFWEPRVHEGKIRIRWKCVSTIEVPGRYNANLRIEMWTVFI